MARRQVWETTCKVFRDVGERHSLERVTFTATPLVTDPRNHPIWVAAGFADPDTTWSHVHAPAPPTPRNEGLPHGYGHLMALPAKMLWGYEVWALGRLVCLVVRLRSNNRPYILDTPRAGVSLEGHDRCLAIATDPRGLGIGRTVRAASHKAHAFLRFMIGRDRRDAEASAVQDRAGLARSRAIEEQAAEEARLEAEREAALAADQLALPL